MHTPLDQGAGEPGCQEADGHGGQQARGGQGGENQGEDSAADRQRRHQDRQSEQGVEAAQHVGQDLRQGAGLVAGARRRAQDRLGDPTMQGRHRARLRLEAEARHRPAEAGRGQGRRRQAEEGHAHEVGRGQGPAGKGDERLRVARPPRQRRGDSQEPARRFGIVDLDAHEVAHAQQREKREGPPET